MELVPNRDCDECTACCHHIPINQDDFVKLANVDCIHLAEGGGCKIYNERPATCAKWYCAWRYMAQLGDTWRPDKSGVLMDFTDQLIPKEFQGKLAIVLKVIDKEKFFSNDQLTQFIAQAVQRNLPAFLAHGLEQGQSAASIFLNNQIQNEVQLNDHVAIKEKLEWALAKCESTPKNIVKIEDGKIVTVLPD